MTHSLDPRRRGRGAALWRAASPCLTHAEAGDEEAAAGPPRNRPLRSFAAAAPIAQFAALLRTLSKGAGRQVVVAVHERALFDYLTLELRPAFPGDTPITVEISRTFAGETVARSTPNRFEDDKVVAAQAA